MGKLDGKVAIVTGGSRGIGAASALALADEGAHVAISYSSSADQAEAVVAALKAKGVRAAAFQADQADSTQAAGLVQSVAQQFGRLDILVTTRGSLLRPRSTARTRTRLPWIVSSQQTTPASWPRSGRHTRYYRRVVGS